MDSEELLAQLADIHLPGPISWWPPAPGWWVLLVLVMALMAYLGRRAQRAYGHRMVQQFALTELQHCHDRYQESDEANAGLRLVNEVNTVLRRVALAHYRNAEVASLTGLAWADFLRNTAADTPLSDTLHEALASGRFQRTIVVDPDALNAFAKAWVTRHASRASDQPATANSREVVA